MSGMLKKILDRIPFIEAIRAFLEQWGLWGSLTTIGGIALSLLISFSAWLNEQPFWVAALVLLAAAALSAVIIDSILSIIWRNKNNPIRHRPYGKQLIERSEQMLDFLNLTLDGIPPAQQVPPTSEESMLQNMNEKNQIRDRIIRRFMTKYAASIARDVDKLKKLEIKIPFHIASTIDSNPGTFAFFLGYVGEMLADGDIESARAIDNAQGFDLATKYFKLRRL